MKHFLSFILLVGIVACHNTKKDQKPASPDSAKSLNVNIIKDVLQRDSIQKQWEDHIYKNWVESDNMPYFILDRQIERLLKNQKLNETDKLILNYRLVYNYYYRRFIYDSIQYQKKSIDLLIQTLDSDTDLVRSSIYFKTTPDKMEKYINEIKNAKTNKVQDSLIWHRINSDQRLKDY